LNINKIIRKASKFKWFWRRFMWSGRFRGSWKRCWVRIYRRA